MLRPQPRFFHPISLQFDCPAGWHCGPLHRQSLFRNKPDQCYQITQLPHPPLGKKQKSVNKAAAFAPPSLQCMTFWGTPLVEPALSPQLPSQPERHVDQRSCEGQRLQAVKNIQKMCGCTLFPGLTQPRTQSAGQLAAVREGVLAAACMACTHPMHNHNISDSHLCSTRETEQSLIQIIHSQVITYMSPGGREFPRHK